MSDANRSLDGSVAIDIDSPDQVAISIPDVVQRLQTPVESSPNPLPPPTPQPQIGTLTPARVSVSMLSIVDQVRGQTPAPGDGVTVAVKGPPAATEPAPPAAKSTSGRRPAKALDDAAQVRPTAQWLLRKAGTMGTLASSAEIGVWSKHRVCEWAREGVALPLRDPVGKF